ncbi:MAG: helix-turn-helix transcriptional regulator [Ruminococcaceae bacterium]|nr:helix-turn-helix transcriptional regulator [Oscillospiraceae bacterium]
MDYIEGLNLSIAYIEDNLFEEIDYEKAARIAGMSKPTYQRFFLLIANMTLDEYIRKRKLQYAVRELTDTEYKVIDIAVKYGYNSAAFSRAIRNFTGNTPSEIRKEGSSVRFPKLNFQIRINEGEMIMNETAIVKIEEHRNEKVVCFNADCVDPENEAWGQMAEWCKKNVPDRTARRYAGVASSGHHPQGEEHRNASEHIKHPYKAMMYLVGNECDQEEFHGLKVEDAPSGLFLVNDVTLNQFDENDRLDIALSMMKASEAFVEFIKNTAEYEFDCPTGIFYEEHIFSEEWFQNGGVPNGFRMWVPIIKI